MENNKPIPLEDLTLEQMESALRVFVAQKGELIAKLQLVEFQCSLLEQQFNKARSSHDVTTSEDEVRNKDED